jgi:hypothetical protein
MANGSNCKSDTNKEIWAQLCRDKEREREGEGEREWTGLRGELGDETKINS